MATCALATSDDIDFAGTQLTATEIWIACMLQADGSKCNNSPDAYKLGFRKERKINKAKELLGIEPRLYYKSDRQWQYYFSYVKFKSSILCPTTKAFNLKGLSTKYASIFVAALRFWDSHERNTIEGAFQYTSTIKKNVEEVQAYLVRAGYSCHMHAPYEYNFGKDNKRKGTSYRVYIRPGTVEDCKKKDITSYNYKGVVGCVTVPDGHILVRANGRTYLTGNCQQFPKKEGFLASFIPEEGNVFTDFDVNGLEMVVQSEFSNDTTMNELYASGKDNDVYLYWAQFIHPDVKFREQLKQEYKNDNEILDVLKKKYKVERSFTKTPVLSFSYGMHPPTLMKRLNLAGYPTTLAMAEDIYNRYWTKLQGLKRWEQELLEEMECNNGIIRNGIGHPICIINDNKNKRKIVSKFTQNTGHTVLMVLNRIIHNLIKERGIRGWAPVIQDFHDERIDTCLKEDAPKLVQIYNDALEIMNNELECRIKFRISPCIGDSIYEFKK
jgi:hypothetical protein